MTDYLAQSDTKAPTSKFASRKSDVIIVGGGPAGLATALLLSRRGLKTTILELSKERRQRVGEVLPPAIRQILSEFCLWEEFIADNHLRSAGVRLWWGDSVSSEWDYIRGPYGDGWHINRSRFETMLAKAALASGAIINFGARVLNIHRGDGNKGWFVEMLSDGKINTWQADFLVHAAGRATLFQKITGGRERIDRLVGVACYYENSDESLVPEPRLWLETSCCGWWYTAPLPDQRLVAVFLTDADLFESPAEVFFVNKLKETFSTNKRVEPYCSVSKIQVYLASSERSRNFTATNFLTVGDASFTVDPASGRGIVKALRSAKLAAQTIVEHLSGQAKPLLSYESHLEDEFQRYVKGLVNQYTLEKRWANDLFWKRRHGLNN